MAPKYDIILVTSEPRVVASVSAALQLNGRFSSQGVFNELQGLSTRLENTPSAAVLVDIDPAPQRILADVDLLTRRHVAARFVVLSSSVSSELMLAAMQAGARHFVLKESIGSDLGGIIQRLAPMESAPEQNGSSITILSAGGGCGATTLAANLAGELRTASQEPVLIVDLDAAYGAVATYLGVQGPYGVADVLAHEGIIDSQLVASTAVHYSEGIDVLLSPVSTGDLNKGMSLPPARLAGMLDACRRSYRYTVIDAPRVGMDVAAELTAGSTATLIVLQLTVKDVRMARSISAELIHRGHPASSLIGVVSRWRCRHCMISQEELQRALGHIQLAYVSNEFSTALRALNFGQLMATEFPRSRIRRDIQALAETVIRAAETASAGGSLSHV